MLLHNARLGAVIAEYKGAGNSQGRPCARRRTSHVLVVSAFKFNRRT